MALNARQKQAVEYLDGPLLVLAGPGTGKTQLLSEKVAYILKNTDTNPENILCLTFTDSAASNMRERLKKIVGSAASKVNIGTYHSFGTEILSRYKNYSDEYDRKLDEAIDDLKQFKIIKAIVDKLPGTDILHGDNIKDIVDVISSAKSYGLSAKDLAKIAEQNIEDSKVLSEVISPLLENIVPRAFKESYENAYQPIYEILKNYTETKPILPRVERSIGGLVRDLKAATIEALSEEKIKPLSAWKDSYFEKDGNGNYRLKDRIANKKLTSIAVVMAEYEKTLKKEGLYDFNDMVEEAVKVLKADEGFRLTLEEQYQFIMLDEFQDTNPSQFEIVKQLTDYEKPMIMAVGDDDQAIYEFQGALATNFSDFQDYYGAEVISLVENYRSTQEILDFSQKVIEQATDRFVGDKELFAHLPSPKKTQIFREEFISSDSEYAFVAKKIHELIKAGVKQSDIAVISYKTKYFMPLLPFLKSYPEIKIAYEKSDNLLEDEKIHEILTISRYVYEIANEKKPMASIMEILAYPFWELPMLEVIKAVGKAREDHKNVLESLVECDNEKIRTVAGFLVELVAKSWTEPLEIFLDYVIGLVPLNDYRSPFLEYYTSKTDFEAYTLYEKIAALRGKLHKYYGEKKIQLSDMISMVDDYLMAEMSINIDSPYKDADESVQILSAHKAKGLEFPYVFLISVDHMAWGKGKGNNNLLSLPKNLTQIRHTGITDGEKLRVLYVALTRAKHTLYLTNSRKDFNGRSPERLEYLSEYEDGAEVISPFLPSGKVNLHYEESASVPSENNLKNWLTPYITCEPNMKAIYKSKVENWRMSASALTSFIDVVYAGPEDFFKNYILEAPREPENEALIFGNLIHKVFEKVTNQKISDEKAVEFFLDELEKVELPVETMQKLRDKGPADLTKSLSAFRKILHEGKAEVNLASEKIAVNGVPITGKIDHILIDEKNKTIEVFDFKTGGYHKEKWQSHATLYKYMLQLEFYKLLLNNSATYKKYKVEKAHILFVTPDKDGEVYDKVYEYDEKDEKELLRLMKTVYDLVTSLEFMNDPEIFVSADNSLGLTDIKKFITLLLEKENKK